MRRASLALETYRAQLQAHPEAIELPEAQVSNGDVLVAEVGEEIVGSAALAGSELDGLFVGFDARMERATTPAAPCACVDATFRHHLRKDSHP